jgi:hypothetical protein
MRNSSDVPEARGERARQEAAGVVGEVGHNHIDDLLGKSRGQGGACDRRVLRGTPKESIFCSCQTSVPDMLGNRCNGKQRDATIRQGVKWRIVGVPDSRDVGVFVFIVLLFQEVEARRDCRGRSLLLILHRTERHLCRTRRAKKPLRRTAHASTILGCYFVRQLFCTNGTTVWVFRIWGGETTNGASLNMWNICAWPGWVYTKR